MGLSSSKQSITINAGSDLSAKQFYFVDVNSSGLLALAGDGANAVGVLQDKPSASGRAGHVQIGGRTKVIAGGTVTAGDSVASDSGGKCVTAATGDVVLGVCLNGGAANAIIDIIFQPQRNALG